MPTPVVLEKDPAMSNSNNYIVNETVVLNSLTGNLFVPQYGCFFTENLLIRKVGFSGDLRPYLDYTAIHTQQDAVAESGREVCSVLRIDLASWEGTYQVSYHAYGGEYSSNLTVLDELLAYLQSLGDTVNWGDIVGKPNQFNPAHHVHNVEDDIVRWNDLVDELKNLTTAVNNGGIANVNAIFSFMQSQFTAMAQTITTAIATHNSAGTAHNKTAVGLGNVDNLPSATTALLNANTPSFITLGSLKQAIAKGFFGGYSSVTSTQLNAVVTATGVYNLTEVMGTVPTGWYAVIQVPEQDKVMDATTSRVQVLVGCEGATLGVCAVRNYSSGTSTWSAFTRFDVKTLANVPNWAPAAAGDVAANTTVDNKFINPLMMKTFINNVLGNVANLSLANPNTIAWNTTDNTHYVSPLGVRNYINNRIGVGAGDASDPSNNDILMTPSNVAYYLSVNLPTALSGAGVSRIGTINFGPFINTTTKGYLVCHNGASFNMTDPQYAALYSFIASNYLVIPGAYDPSLRGAFFKLGNIVYLPNMDGLFVRGVGGSAAGNGVYQGDAIRNITGSFIGNAGTGFRDHSGAMSSFGVAAGYDSGHYDSSKNGVNFDASLVVPTANENRPVNVGWYYVIWYR